ncbi:MAG: hypothetical protein PHW00_03175 [Clostridia bacterium]|nr:hypothetical protein [Clostridia bacterium]
MKNVYRCKYETIPGNGEKIKQFSSCTEVERFVRKEIISKIDISYCIAQLKKCNMPNVDKLNEELLKYIADDEYCIKGNYEFENDICTVSVFENNICIIFEDDFSFVCSGDADNYKFDCCNQDNLPEEALKGMDVQVEETIKWGNSAFPIMVLRALSNEPKSQTEIITSIKEQYSVSIGRKAIGCHIQLLKELGYRIERNKQGYFLK